MPPVRPEERGVELYQVKYFVALAHSLNFTRAAELSNVSQPALTKAIRKLEEELGGELILRERTLTQLTELGKTVLPAMEGVLSALERVSSGAREFRSNPALALHVGLSPTVSPTVLSEVFGVLAAQLPQLEVQVDDVSTACAAESLLRGDVLAVLTGCEDIGHAGRLDCWRLFKEPFVVHLSKSDPLASLAVVPFGALADRDWLGCPDTDLDLAAGRARLPNGAVRIRHFARRVEHLHAMVQAGLGVALVPAHTPCPQTVVARPIGGRPLERTVSLVVVAGRPYSTALAAFIRLCRACDWERQFQPLRPPLPVAPLAVAAGVPDISQGAAPARNVDGAARIEAGRQ